MLSKALWKYSCEKLQRAETANIQHRGLFLFTLCMCSTWCIRSGASSFAVVRLKNRNGLKFIDMPQYNILASCMNSGVTVIICKEAGRLFPINDNWLGAYMNPFLILYRHLITLECWTPALIPAQALLLFG